MTAKILKFPNKSDEYEMARNELAVLTNIPQPEPSRLFELMTKLIELMDKSKKWRA